MATQSQGSSRNAQARAVHSVGGARNRPYKRVPSALTAGQQLEAVQSLRAGRNVHQVACEFSCAPWVVMELWVRDVSREWMRRAA